MAGDLSLLRTVCIVGTFLGLTEACSSAEGDNPTPYPQPSTEGGLMPPIYPGANGGTPGYAGMPNPVGGAPYNGGLGGATPIPPIMMGGSTFGTGGMGVDEGDGGAPPVGQGGQGGTEPLPPGGTPVIPAVAGECPAWANGTITFMGLGGIRVAAGAKAGGPTAPILFYWHGTGSTSGEYSLMAGPVANGVVSQGGIIVSFQGTTGGDLYSGTNIFGVGDMKLVDQLLACAVRDYNIDPRRVYTMGCSAGGLFSAALASQRSSYIAAAAPNSGGWVLNSPWQDANKPALMTVHGAAGRDVVVVDFATTSATADKGFKAHGSFVMDCDTGGTHCGGAPLAGDVWKFFQAHPFGSPSPWAGGLPAGFSSQCKIIQ
jgi:predicted esterase